MFVLPISLLQNWHRKNTSYAPEEFPVKEIDYPLFSAF
jgi:hypothetical protein